MQNYNLEYEKEINEKNFSDKLLNKCSNKKKLNIPNPERGEYPEDLSRTSQILWNLDSAYFSPKVSIDKQDPEKLFSDFFSLKIHPKRPRKNDSRYKLMFLVQP